jgi:tRNA dimethylallyltransferase
MSSWHEEKTAPCISEANAFLLVRDREALRKRIEKRVQGMWTQGWPDEVKELLKRPGWEGSQSFKALGYKEVAACLRGEMTPEACREAIVLQTHQYAKRQLTWFRREINLQVIEWNDSDSEATVASRLQKHLEAPSSSP